MARWFLTLQSALIPQDNVKHGFSHFSFMHARWEGQSGSTKHSGWGAEKESFMQVKNPWTLLPHICWPPINWRVDNGRIYTNLHHRHVTLFMALFPFQSPYLYGRGLCMTRVKLQPFVPTHLNHKVVQYFCLTYVGCTLCVGIQYSHLDRYTLDCDWQPCKEHLGHKVCQQHMDWCIFCFCRMCNLDSRHLIHIPQTAVELQGNPLKERKEGNFMQKIGYKENQ